MKSNWKVLINYNSKKEKNNAKRKNLLPESQIELKSQNFRILLQIPIESIQSSLILGKPW